MGLDMYFFDEDDEEIGYMRANYYLRDALHLTNGEERFLSLPEFLGAVALDKVSCEAYDIQYGRILVRLLRGETVRVLADW